MNDPQRTLFECDPAAWEVDDAQRRPIATVVLPTGVPKPLDYLVPAALVGQVQVGCRVRVGLGRGNRPVVGYCVSIEHRASARRLKPIHGVVDRRSLISPAMMRTTMWMAEHYMCGWGQVLQSVVPAGVRGQAGTRMTGCVVVDDPEALRDVRSSLPAKQRLVVDYLLNFGATATVRDVTAACKCTQAPINTLAKRGLLRIVKRRLATGAMQPAAPAERERSLVLNPDQEGALAAIRTSLDAAAHATILIHGVTGSGKTEVYIQAIEQVVQFGRQAIVLVPEISLTPQTCGRFRARFDQVAVLHSHLSDSERHWHWERIVSGEVQVVVGARSAVFAPTPHLGLVILDEEHESSFKQDSTPRYHARDVALHRARGEGVPLVLGSATPSLESWHRAQQGDYRLVSMPRRIHNRPLPDVATIDLRDEQDRRAASGALSRQLTAAMQAALADGGQVILLLNRRGFSTHIQCPSCGKVVVCPDCDIALTHHRTHDIALCHWCDFQMPAPQTCPACGFEGIRYSGRGTQRLEAEVRARFPKHECLRMDTDTMRGHGSHEAALEKFRSGEVRILLGTQMIAKGLDFPNVTLVGVVNADVGLHFPDLRAAERTFQLVTQVAGRTGRGEKGGRVLVQTRTPDHPAIAAATRHDYHAFAAGELPHRKALGYPPYGAMIRIVVEGHDARVAQVFAEGLGERIDATLAASPGTARKLGPAPAPMARRRGRYRFQIHLHGPDGDLLRAAAGAATEGLKLPEEVYFTTDVDPIDMM